MEYVEALNAALKYGMAPADEIKALAAECHKGGSFTANNTADGVLADFFADHGDGREEIVRRDLSYRGETNGHYHTNYGKHKKELLLTHNAGWGEDDEFKLPDGSTLRHTPLFGHNGRKASELHWSIPVERDAINYCALFTPEETDRILGSLGLTVDHPDSPTET